MPIGADGTIYVGSYDKFLYAITPAPPGSTTATLKWKYQTEKQVYSSPAVGANGVIYVGSYDHYLYALDPNPASPPADQRKWRYDTGTPVASSPVIGPDSTVYVGSNVTLHAIVSSGGGLGKTPWPMFHLDTRHTGNLAKITSPEAYFADIIPQQFTTAMEGALESVAEEEAVQHAHGVTALEQLLGQDGPDVACAA